LDMEVMSTEQRGSGAASSYLSAFFFSSL